MIGNGVRPGPASAGANPDDLSREVYCILGVPIDAIEMPDALRRIRTAAASRIPFLLSTPNLNFLIASQSDTDFRQSLLRSDLCPADGMPIVWIARLLGVPIARRVAGSDMFDALMADASEANPLNVYLFGGAEGVAEAACRAVNARPAGLRCAGSFYPGFGSVAQMSSVETIDTINASGADMLVVALGAKKGQAWLLRNHDRLHIPVRAHLGAVINFHAGSVKRAPAPMRKSGLEWAWRIAQEPSLWRRYWGDGCALLGILLTRVLPLAVWSRSLRGGERDLSVALREQQDTVVVGLNGAATAAHVEKIAAAFRAAIATRRRIAIDLSGTACVDARVLGLFLMLNKTLANSGATATLTGLTPRLERLFRLHGLGFLVPSRQQPR